MKVGDLVNPAWSYSIPPMIGMILEVPTGEKEPVLVYWFKTQKERWTHKRSLVIISEASNESR